MSRPKFAHSPEGRVHIKGPERLRPGASTVARPNGLSPLSAPAPGRLRAQLAAGSYEKPRRLRTTLYRRSRSTHGEVAPGAR
jgi:hypothetical protein